ncbi:pleckstrin homology domain-containing family G member 7 isoform X2 [Electrophorus electricus]|uniref:DH domain-containing protein n=1 Tax=Electrophorus electricus TaxID=8005 RepID=A0A4W4ESK0_ELEEL|nr:pleckstrin homology domain-containing family G member 7 isoform X2 [Electrophorus electricus]
MTEVNHIYTTENGKDAGKPLDWKYIEWHDDGMTRGTDAHTQTTCEITVDKETQTHNLGMMHSELARTPSEVRYRALMEVDGTAKPLFQFDRLAPARISTSPTLRRVRSTRLSFQEMGKLSSTQEESSTRETPSPRSPLSPAHHEKSPLAAPPLRSDRVGTRDRHPDMSVSHRKIRSHVRSKTFSSRAVYRREDVLSPTDSTNSDTASETEQAKEFGHTRLQERRRSSVVVTLPGSDVSPGDLFVSNGVVDILNQSTYSDTKKSKWLFSRRSTTKVKTRTSADVDKCLAGFQVQDWRDTNFQKYKDSSLKEFLMSHLQLRAEDIPKKLRRQEAIWELFTSECVYFLDQLMVLKEVFLIPLTELQLSECLQDIDAWMLFANLKELCLISFGFLTSLLHVVKEMWASPETDYPMETLLALLNKAFGESICQSLQKYCLNYSTAILYLDSLRTREDFGSYLKWCEKSEHCRKLRLKDLLVVPLQRFTRYPLFLKNMEKRSRTREEECALHRLVELVDRAIYDLEGKVKWLDNYQRVKRLKESLVWLPVWERGKKSHVPENLKHLIKAATPENLISHRNLLHDGKLTLTENTKLQEVYLFLFDEFLLITKIKRKKKQKPMGPEQSALHPAATPELAHLLQEGCSFIVLDQPISLDRLQLRNIDQLNATASGLPYSFMLMHHNRYQQCIGVFVLQAHTESIKKAWLSEIEEAVGALLNQDCGHPHVKNSSLYLESSQI